MEPTSTGELNSSCAPGHTDCTGRGDEGLNMPPPLLSSSFYITVPVIYSVICAVGLTGNTAVIYVILKAPKMKTVTNIFILNLAIADKLFTLVLPINIADYLLLQWPFGEFMCKLIISIDQYNIFSTVKIVSLCIWSFVTVIILPFTVFAEIHKEQGHSQCVFVRIYTFILGFAIPVSTICILYTIMLYIPQTPLIIGISYFIASLSYTNSCLNPFLSFPWLKGRPVPHW
uniref:G-protein coupled receptors family 1 profile domain-containing protein n=1 Tax=Anas platyrhynchos TaxID=8839 RepID=A0A8B9ZJ35_ANAPL